MNWIREQNLCLTNMSLNEYTLVQIPGVLQFFKNRKFCKGCVLRLYDYYKVQQRCHRSRVPLSQDRAELMQDLPLCGYVIQMSLDYFQFQGGRERSPFELTNQPKHYKFIRSNIVLSTYQYYLFNISNFLHTYRQWRSQRQRIRVQPHPH